MDIIDEEGRLFGVVNVIDALVVVFVLAVVISGVALFLGGGEPSSPSSGEDQEDPEPLRYGTVTYDVPLHSPAATLEPGDELDSGGSTFNVTDVLRSTTPEGDASITVHVVYRGEFVVDGNRVFVGDSVSFTTDDSRVSAAVDAVGLEHGLLESSEQQLVVRANDSNAGARVVRQGDQLVVGDHQIGSIAAVESGPDGRTLVGVNVTTRETPAGQVFGGRLVRVGHRIGIVTDEAVVRGQIVAVGTNDPADVS